MSATTTGIQQISGNTTNRRLPAINETISSNEPKTTIDSTTAPTIVTNALPSSGSSSSRNRATNSSGGVVRAPRNDDAPHIGKYRLIKTIGKGNFAKVKLAKHELIGKEVCVYLLSN
jgi:MAP/microtubule affinity-regulating kinase